MTTEKAMKFIPAVYALPKVGEEGSNSFPAASPDNIPLYAVPLPLSFATWSEDVQYAYVKERIRDHYIRNEGLLPFVGPIALYALQRSPEEEPIPLSIYGDPMTPEESQTIRITLTPSEWQVSKRIFVNSLCSKDENTFH